MWCEQWMKGSPTQKIGIIWFYFAWLKHDLYFFARDSNLTKARWIFKPCQSTCRNLRLGIFFGPKYHITTVVLPSSKCRILDPEIAKVFTKHADTGKKHCVECIFLHLNSVQKEHGSELQLKLPSTILKQYALFILRETIREKQMDLNYFTSSDPHHGI